MAKSGESLKSEKGVVKIPPKPSARLNSKTRDAFAPITKSTSAFVTVYANGGIPCRLVHGSVRHKLAWNIPPEKCPLDPTLVTLTEGLRETNHPYNFVARRGFNELLQISDAKEQALPLLTKLAPPLKAALSHKDDAVFSAAVESVTLLSRVVGDALNCHLKTLLAPISRRLMEKKFRDDVTCLLEELVENGGKEAYDVIKSRIPTYVSSQ